MSLKTFPLGHYRDCNYNLSCSGCKFENLIILVHCLKIIWMLYHFTMVEWYLVLSQDHWLCWPSKHFWFLSAFYRRHSERCISGSSLTALSTLDWSYLCLQLRSWLILYSPMLSLHLSPSQTYSFTFLFYIIYKY